MSSFGEMMGEFFDLYSAGNYADALSLVTRELPEHPSDQAILLCFSAAMSARLGDTPSALCSFRTALDYGYWYHEGALRGDPDFASLQEDSEFKAIIEQNAQRRQAALADIKPILHVLEPDDVMQPAPLLIALHGNLSHVDGYAVHWQSAVEKGWRVALPQSSCPSWVSGFYDWPDIDVALNELDQHYQTLITNYAVDPSQVVIAGFSNGGRVAERAAVTRRLPVRGLLWIEGAPDPDFKQILVDHTPSDLRAYFVFGPSQDFRQSAESLSHSLIEAGASCQLEPMVNRYHDIPSSFPQTLDRALAFLYPSR